MECTYDKQVHFCWKEGTKVFGFFKRRKRNKQNKDVLADVKAEYKALQKEIHTKQLDYLRIADELGITQTAIRETSDIEGEMLYVQSQLSHLQGDASRLGMQLQERALTLKHTISKLWMLSDKVNELLSTEQANDFAVFHSIREMRDNMEHEADELMQKYSDILNVKEVSKCSRV